VAGKILSALIACMSISEIKEAATEFVTGVANRFALLILYGRQPSSSLLTELPVSVLTTAIMKTLQMENRERSKPLAEVLSVQFLGLSKR
jgi:hypothetical protein